MVSLHQPEVREGHSSSQFPSLLLPDESPLQLLYEEEEPILVGEGASTVRSTRVLPVEVQTVKVVLV